MELEELQAEEELPWAVIDSDGEVTKGGFKSEEDARAWMDTSAGKEVLAKRGGSFDVEQQTNFDAAAEEADGAQPEEDKESR